MILCYGVRLVKILITNILSNLSLLTSPIPEHDLLEFKFQGDQIFFGKTCVVAPFCLIF